MSGQWTQDTFPQTVEDSFFMFLKEYGRVGDEHSVYMAKLNETLEHGTGQHIVTLEIDTVHLLEFPRI